MATGYLFIAATGAIPVLFFWTIAYVCGARRLLVRLAVVLGGLAVLWPYVLLMLPGFVLAGVPTLIALEWAARKPRA